jgi:hypothetical protein
MFPFTIIGYICLINEKVIKWICNIFLLVDKPHIHITYFSYQIILYENIEYFQHRFFMVWFFSCFFYIYPSKHKSRKKGNQKGSILIKENKNLIWNTIFYGIFFLLWIFFFDVSCYA